MSFEKIYVIDTNIILGDAQQLLTIGQNGKNLIVLPETVIDELDIKKTGFDEINFQAREFGRILSEAEVIETKKVGKSKDVTIMRLSVQGIIVDIISFKDYELTGVDKAVINDRRIIKVAEFATTHYKDPQNTSLLSNDIMCRTRAVSFGVQAQGLDKNKDELQSKFVKHLDNVDEDKLDTLDGRDIREFDQEWEPQNYCYHLKSASGNERIGYVIGTTIYSIEDHDFDGLPVKPLNIGQRFAIAGMLDRRIDVCIMEALAGSGKTLLALSAGMKMVREGVYDKIIYIRNSVESVDKAEEVGFLSGNEEKFKIYNYPLYDTLEFIAQREVKKKDFHNTDNHSVKPEDLAKKYNKKKETAPTTLPVESINTKIDELTQKYHIETMWTGSIRGRTLSNAFVIIDEVQNFAKPSLRTVLSRMDKDCKVICIGSNRQIDHPYINKYTNGLSTLIKAAKEDSPEVTLFGTELDKVVRGKITEWTERIFD